MQLSITDIRELIGGSNSPSHSFVVGEKYLFRSVTYFHTGRIKSITDSDIVLEDAAWIGDTGRFNACLATGKPSEVEPFVGDVILSRAVIVDATKWSHDLPTEVA